MYAVKKLLNFQDKSGNFYTHLFGVFHIRKTCHLISLNRETPAVFNKSLYKYKHFPYPYYIPEIYQYAPFIQNIHASIMEGRKMLFEK